MVIRKMFKLVIFTPCCKYRKRRPKRFASVSVFLCAFPFHKNFIHAHAPQP